ncbi:MAG: hypothetical protein WD851_09590 [Pirellulales bacterium]
MSTSKKLPRHFVALLLCLGMAAVATAADRTWIGGNADWTSSNANWNPADEPDPDDVAIFNTSNSVDLANAFEQILGLTMSGGISLSLNDNGMSVNGPIQLTGASTDLVVGGSNAILTALHAITINSGAELTVAGGQMGVYGQSGVGLLDVNAGGELSGNGLILLADSVSAGVQLLDLDGTLTAHSTAAGDILSLAFATLTITVSDIDGVIDLDGNSGASTINVSRNDTLAINGGVLDGAYSGTINLSAGATFSRNRSWSLDGTLNANTGGSTAATIAGTFFTQLGGSINVDAGESLRLSSVFDALDGTIVNNGLIIFNNTATIQNAVQFQTGSQGSIEVNGEVEIHDQGWDWDGDGGLDNRITINEFGTLRANFQADDIWDGAMYISGGRLFVSQVDNEWGQSGGLINVVGGTASSLIAGGKFSKTGGDFNVEPAAVLSMHPESVWSGGTLNVDGHLHHFRPVTWNGGIAVTGSGTIYTHDSSAVAADTTITVNTFDWDGTFGFGNGGFLHTINDGVQFRINASNFDADDDDMDDPINLGGNGASLVISGPAQWIMNDTLTANTAGAGTASIGGTRMVLAGILDVNGDTDIGAKITFDGGSTTFVQAGTTLKLQGFASNQATYDGGLITGAGTFFPAGGLGSNSAEYQNFVQSNSTISTDTFQFGYGGWWIEPGATLTVDVDDYQILGSGTNGFSAWIAINSGTVNVNTGDAEFVLVGLMDLNNTTGTAATWTGEPLSIGVDAGGIHGFVRVGGTGISRINSVITFRSDAKVAIEAGTTLVLGNSASFYPVNGADNAEFTGAGALVTNDTVNFAEATTLNMVGGTVDFDGETSDSTGNRIDVDAPLVINAAILEDFGETKMTGSDTLDIDNQLGAGSLTVNLDDPNAEWTLSAHGSMILVNDNTNAVLLAGSDVNINGRLLVGGEVQTNARLDFGASAEVPIATAGEPFHLNGGNNTDDPNTIAGAFILGPGVLAASDGRALHGFGQIMADVDFDGAAHVLAQGGSLILGGAIVDVGTLGTADGSGILDVVNLWNTNVTDLVQLNGGELRGGTVANDGANGLNGFGLISSRVINSTRIDAEGGTLVVETANNDNDWDGATGTGSLNAVSGDLEVRDDATFLFTGTASASANRTVFANDFELEFEPGSTLTLADGARYRSTNGTDIGGAVTVTGGTASLEIDGTTVLENGSATMLTGNLRLENPVTVVQAGAMFAGGGTLINAANRTLRLLDGANVGVLIQNQGTLELGASPGQVLGIDFQQDSSGAFEIEIAGIGLNDFDRLTLTGQAQIAGELNVSLLDGFTPVLGNVFGFLSAVGGVAGTFQTTSLPDLAAGLSWSISYNPTNVQLSVVQALPGDYNEDGAVNAADYTVWRDQLGGGTSLPNDDTAGVGPDDYDRWNMHFGQNAGTGSNGPDAVPEPSALQLLLLAAAGVCLKLRQAGW